MILVEDGDFYFMDWARILAYITGTVDQELLLRNEYLVAENRIIKAQLKTPLRLTDAERITLAKIAHRLGRKALEDVANVVKPDTIRGWYRKLIARKFDGSRSRRYPGRPRIDSEKEEVLSKLILIGEASLRRALREYLVHFHQERNHQGKGNVLMFPSSQASTTCRSQSVCCRERLGGLLKYYHRQAA